MSEINYQKNRKKAPERPDFNFLEIFWRFAPDDRGNMRKLSLRERWNRGAQLAEWYVHRAEKRVGELFGNGKDKQVHDPMDADRIRRADPGFRPGDPDETMERREAFREQDERQRERERERERERQREGQRGSEGEAGREREEGRVYRLGPESGEPSVRDEGIRVYLRAPATGNRVGSDRVGPERRVEVSRDPWPLAPPGGKSAAARLSAPEPAGPDGAPPAECSDGLSDGPADGADAARPAPRSLPAPDRAQSRGEAASEKGARAAREKTARKAAERAAARDATPREDDGIDL